MTLQSILCGGLCSTIIYRNHGLVVCKYICNYEILFHELCTAFDTLLFSENRLKRSVGGTV